jgi:nicotinamide phosphoribosyltransferase
MRIKPKAQPVDISTEFKFDLSGGIIAAVRKNYGLIGDADGYKYSHSGQYPQATRMMSYIESRGGMFDSVMMAGAQLIVLEYFTQRVTDEQVENIRQLCELYGAPFDRKAWIKVVEVYDGYPPIIIKSVAEGTTVPVSNVLLTIETSVDDRDVFSLVSFFETKLLRMWSPSTVATISNNARKAILAGLNESCDNPAAMIDNMLVDFGSRGTTSLESSSFSGVGHLFNFTSTDNVASVLAANLAYNAECAGGTIPASEHSTVGSWGDHNEEGFMRNMLDIYGAGFMLACVSDTYDIENAIKNYWGGSLKQQIIEQNAIVVVRPDSNNPVLMPIKCVQWLEEAFGCTVNNKGYKVLNHVRVLQGDGIEIERIIEICNLLMAKGYSVENVSFGMGAGLLQKNDRDTQKFACKCCAIMIDGEWIDVYKNPVNADLSIDDQLNIEYIPVNTGSFKRSKSGRLTLIHNEVTGEYRTIRVSEMGDFDDDWIEALDVIFENGRVMKVSTLAEVRALVRKDEVYITA